MSNATMEHSFSIELNSRSHLIHVSISDEGENTLVEGVLGCLSEVRMRDDVLLEVYAEQGVLRLDISRGELEKALKIGDKGVDN